ncbi:extracellular solute-binding protein [Halegenticoccus soli]|uniref:extracellular solute-binding protein n=1 Tax=Halegenticoccus soli TaxID=1985678 RepID=UPI000C6E054B|nr:extracellular solute-binding protein [Halegenticoccus soli]
MRENRVTRRKALAIAGGAGAAGLAGCASGGRSGDSGQSDGSNSATLWAWNDPGLSPIREEQAKEFEKKHGLDGVNWQYYPFDNYLAKATSAIPAGNAPDSLALSVLWVPRFGDKGVAVNLEEHGFSPDDYVTAARNNSSYDGTLWSVPWYADCRLLCINKQMFEQAGLEVPDPSHRPSWDEFANWVEELGKEHGTGYSMAAGEGLDAFVLSNGSGYLTEDGSKAAINNAAAVEAAEFLQPMVVEDEHVLARTSGTTHVEDFLSGQAPMLYAGSWHYPRLRDSGIDWQYNPHPGGPRIEKSHTWSAGVYYSVPSRGGADQEIGRKWLEYIDSMEVQKNVTRAMGGFPGRKDAYETDAFKQYLDDHPKLKVVAQEMENAVAFPSHPDVGKMWTAVHTQAEAIFQGTDPKSALDKAAEEINGLL